MTHDEVMDCEEARELMAAVVDGEVGARARAAFDAHIVHCEGCADDLRRSRRLAAALHALPSETSIGPDFERGALARAREALHAPGRVQAGSASGWLGWSARGVAAAAALAGAVGLWQLWSTAPRTPVARFEPRSEIPGEVMAEPQRFLDMPVVERLEMLRYLQQLDERDDGSAVERG